jgi:hypothetical protein
LLASISHLLEVPSVTYPSLLATLLIGYGMWNSKDGDVKMV